jgi:hypothetical protein
MRDVTQEGASAMKIILALAASLFFATTASAQTPLKTRVIYDTTDATSSAVTPLLIQKIAAQPKFFTVVNSDERDLAIVADLPDCVVAGYEGAPKFFYVPKQ